MRTFVDRDQEILGMVEGLPIRPEVVLVVRRLVTSLLARTYTDLVRQDGLLWSFGGFLTRMMNEKVQKSVFMR